MFPADPSEAKKVILTSESRSKEGNTHKPTRKWHKACPSGSGISELA